MVRELRESLAKIKSLSRLIAICAWCKKVRDDQGYWHQVELSRTEHATAALTYGICTRVAVLVSLPSESRNSNVTVSKTATTLPFAGLDRGYSEMLSVIFCSSANN
jgi:hypothetical protein